VNTAHKKEWEDWAAEQTWSENDFRETLHPWILPRCRATIDIELPWAARSSNPPVEMLTHEGFTHLALNARKRKAVNDARIEAENMEARTYQAIQEGDFFIYYEEAVEGEENLEFWRSKGISTAESQCCIVLAKANEPCITHETGVIFKALRYRQPLGNLNGKFIPGNLKGEKRSDNIPWVVEVERDSVLIINPGFKSTPATKGRKDDPNVRFINAATKKAIAELPKVVGKYKYVTGGKLMRS
jgi:hypothetical protein